MSFNKAAIKRFNEESSCAPPPTKYDPKTPHGSSGNIHFGLYSGRKEHKLQDNSGFVTPAKPSRGRSTIAGSASVRSCSDTRLRKGMKSSSTKSLQDIPASHLTLQNEELVKQHNTLESELSTVIKEMEIEIQTLTDELVKKQEEIDLLESQAEEMKRNRDEAIQIAEARLAKLLSAKENLEKQYEANQALSNELQDLKYQAEVDASSIQTLHKDILHERENLGSIQSDFEAKRLELTSKIQLANEELSNVTLLYQTIEEQYTLLKQENIELKEAMASQIKLLENQHQIHEERYATLMSEKQRIQSEGEELRKTLAQEKTSAALLKTQLDDSNNRIQQLTTEKENVEAAMQSLEEQLKMETQKMNELQSNFEAEKGDSQRVVESLNKKIEELSSKNKLLLKEHDTLSSELFSVKCEAENYSSTIAALEVELETKQQKIVDMEVCIETEKGKRKEENLVTEKIISDLQSAKENLEQRLQSESDELRKVLAQKEVDITELESQIAVSNNQIQQLTTEKENVEAAMQSLEEQLKMETQKMNELQSNFEAEKGDSQRVVESLNSKIEELSLKNKILMEEHGTLSSELFSVKCEAENYSATIASLEVELQTKQQKVLDLQACMETEKAKREQEVQAAEKIIENLQLEKEDLEKLYETLGNELQDLKHKAEVDASSIQTLNMDILNEREKLVQIQSEFEDEKLELTSKIQLAEQELINVTSSYKMVEEQCNVLKQENVELKQASTLQKELLEDERQSHEGRYANLMTEKQRLQSEIEEIRRTLTQKEVNMTELGSQLDDSNNRIQQLTTEKENVEAAMQSLEEQLKMETQKMNELQSNFEAEKGDSQRVVESLNSKIEELSLKNKLLVEEHGTLSSELFSVKCEAENYSSTIASLEVELQTKQQKFADLEVCIETEKEKREEEVRAAEKIIADLQSANGELQQQHISLNEELGFLKARVEEDTSLMKILNIQLDEQQANFAEIQARFEDERNALSLENAAMKQRLDQIFSSQKTLEEKYSTLKLQYEMLEQENKLSVGRFEEERWQNEMINSNLKSEIQQLQSDTEHLRKQAAKAQLHWNELSTVKSENAILKDRLQNSTYQIEKDQEELRSLTEAVEAYQQKEQDLLQRESQRETLQKKVHELMLENKALKENLDQYKSVYGDYADLASHQNNRQKIKHIVNIKEENIKLREETAVLRQKVVEYKEKLRQVDKQSGSATRRFDPSQAFKPVLKEPFIKDDRDVRGPDARSTFTVPKKDNPKPLVIVDSKQSKQGMAFGLTFYENNKEN